MARYASGKNARAVCDVCGDEVRYVELRPVIVARVRTGVRACKQCWDADHPQNNPRPLVADAEMLRHPRPDRSDMMDIQWGWSPVGGGMIPGLTPNRLHLQCQVGHVEVV